MVAPPRTSCAVK